MKLLVCSRADLASVNIAQRLQEQADWVQEGEFEGRPCLWLKEMCMVEIEELHIHSDHLDVRCEEEIGVHPDLVIFLSRHRAASGIPSLTVHPIGNHGLADFGGRPEHLVPATPHLMTSMLRRLHSLAGSLDFGVSFEVTHHGPYLETPSVFVEIGSDENTWDHRGAAQAIASAILSTSESVFPVVIGIGGGHYAPRFTEIALKKKVSFGHMIPNYALEGGEESFPGIIKRALFASQDSGLAYVHRKSMKKSEASRLMMILEKMGVKVVQGKDLEDL